jgi:hypothetical protein
MDDHGGNALLSLGQFRRKIIERKGRVRTPFDNFMQHIACIFFGIAIGVLLCTALGAF